MLVQELAAKVQQPPSRYMQPEQYHPVSLDVGAETLEPIPVIDLSRLSSTAGGADDDESGKLRLALQTWGLFLVSLSQLLLIDKDVSGLQVLRDGVWHNNVPASPFMLLINVGDFMEVPYSSIVLNYLYTVISVMNCIFQQAVGLTTLTDADN